MGVPSGRRCPKAWVGALRRPIITVANHKGVANAILRESWVVGVKVYGNRPKVFIIRRSNIREMSRVAHLCPFTGTGKKICWVERLINHPSRVVRRLFSQRVVGFGTKIQGRVRASAIRGMPNSLGLINWSKKLNVMVSFRSLFLWF